MMTAHATVDTAREALKRGAVDYITKPIDIEGERKPILANLERASDGDRLERTRASDRVPFSVGPPDAFNNIVGQGPALQDLISKIERVARADAPVLLPGESGTGKEVATSLIHRLSHRADRPFVEVNCAALPETLLESELFGHIRGAFTGATSDRDGLFQVADGGTLLLDEAAQNGGFRQDLYYRLNVVPLEIPPLRDRIEDLPDLIDHFVRSLLARGGSADRRNPRFPPETLRVMARYAWPGNIRELQNSVEYAMVLAETDEVGLGDLPVAIQDHERMLAEPHRSERLPGDEAGTLEDIERRCIVQAMTKTGFNRTRAADLLGVTRRTLSYRISKYDLETALEEMRHRARTRPSIPPPPMGPVSGA